MSECHHLRGGECAAVCKTLACPLWHVRHHQAAPYYALFLPDLAVVHTKEVLAGGDRSCSCKPSNDSASWTVFERQTPAPLAWVSAVCFAAFPFLSMLLQSDLLEWFCNQVCWASLSFYSDHPWQLPAYNISGKLSSSSASTAASIMLGVVLVRVLVSRVGLEVCRRRCCARGVWCG